MKLDVYYLRSFDVYDPDVDIMNMQRDYEGIRVNIYTSKGPGPDKGSTKIMFKPTGSMKG